MRRMEWKWIILITVIILLVAAVAFLFIFVIKPPGSLTHPWLIPKAYTGDAGQTKTLTFAEILNAKQTGPDSLGNDPKESLTFVYVYDPATETGRLGILDSVPSSSVCSMTIYEPEWKGIEGLVSALDSRFAAKIVHRVNMDFMEGEVYLHNTALPSDKEEEARLVDLENPTAPTEAGLQYYFGVMYYDGVSTRVQSLGNGLSAAIMCAKAETDRDAFLSIVKRFDLYDEFCIPK